ncbi:MAG: hypothetical protein RIG62_32155 [Cyclobacteriaceae bacterium]
MDNAWDTDPDSRATLNINASILGGNAYVEYEFASPVAQYDNLILTMSFSGSGFLSGLITSDIFAYLSIQLQNSSGAALATYNDVNLASVKLVNASENQFEIRIINPSADTQRIRITAGSFLSLLGRSCYIYDIVQEEAGYDFITTSLDSGYTEDGALVSISLCLDCTIENKDHATINYDPNSDYTRMVAPLSISTGSKFLFNRYDWGATTYSGLDYDIYLVLAQENFLSLATDLFDENQLAIVLAYTDNTQDTFSVATNNSLIEAEVLYPGSEKFYVKIDADDTKTVDSVEVQLSRPFSGGARMLAPQAAADNDMRVYSVFASESDNAPLPVTLLHFSAATIADKVRLTWTTSAEDRNDYFLIERSTDITADKSSFRTLGKIPGAGHSSNVRYYELLDEHPLTGNNYYRLTQVDFDGSKTHFPISSAFFSPFTNAVTVTADSEENQIYIDFAENTLIAQQALIWLRDDHGRTILKEESFLTRSHVISLSDDLKKGVYLVSILTEHTFVTKKIRLD